MMKKIDKDALKSGIMSFFIMGLGQLRNKQKLKAVIFLSILLLVILIEVLTGSYQYYGSEIMTYPADNGSIYFFRDYGGFFTRSLWGLFTLGKLPLSTVYRGQQMETYNKIIPWLSADNSVTLLGNGLIALVIIALLATIWVIGIRDAYVTKKEYNKTKVIESSVSFFKRIWTELFAYIILVPAMVMILFFTVIPFLFSFSLAFTNYTFKIQVPAKLINWVGFSNFTKIVTDPAWLTIFFKVFLWTILYALMASVTCYILGLINALIIESKAVKFKKFWRTLFSLPWALPAMISLMVFKNVFDTQGLANQLLYATNTMESVSNFLYQIGLQGKLDNPIFWFTATYNGALAKVVIVLVNLWLGSPYFMMLITGVLTTLPKALYEAAEIDGASKIQQFKSLTMPLVLQATLPVIVMTFTFNFNNFGAIYFLTGGGPEWPQELIPQSMRILGGVPGQTDILMTWIYKLSFTPNQQLYNVAAVYSIIIFAFIGIFSVVNLSRSKTLWEEE